MVSLRPPLCHDYCALVRVKCSPEDTVGDLKLLIAAQTGTTASKISLKKAYTVFKDHITLADCELFRW